MKRADVRTVLIIDASAADAAVVAARLLEIGHDVFGGAIQIVHERTLASACRRLDALYPVLILVDTALPDAHGVEAIPRLRQCTQAPLIVLSRAKGDRVAARTLRAGALDYVVKPLGDDASVRRVVAMAFERHRLAAQYEATARRAARLAQARERAAMVVSHDLRAPLNTIRLCATALGETPDAENAGAAHMAHLITQSVVWSQQIVRDLIEHDHLESGRLTVELTTVNVAQLFERAQLLLSTLVTERHIELVIHLADDLPCVQADPHRLLQILSNLVVNAIKFSPAGSRVVLSAHAAAQSAAERQRGRHRSVRLEVRDSGRGIPMADLAHVFDWQWRAGTRGEATDDHAASEGSGIGLSIVKGLVEAHGSQLHVSTAPGHGTTFSFVLPPAQRSPVATSPLPLAISTVAAARSKSVPRARTTNTNMNTNTPLRLRVAAVAPDPDALPIAPAFQ